MKTLLKNANCLEEVVSSNARKVHEICDIPIFVPVACLGFHHVPSKWSAGKLRIERAIGAHQGDHVLDLRPAFVERADAGCVRGGSAGHAHTDCQARSLKTPCRGRIWRDNWADHFGRCA